jgi:hypothetical protein
MTFCFPSFLFFFFQCVCVWGGGGEGGCDPTKKRTKKSIVLQPTSFASKCDNKNNENNRAFTGAVILLLRSVKNVGCQRCRTAAVTSPLPSQNSIIEYVYVQLLHAFFVYPLFFITVEERGKKKKERKSQDKSVKKTKASEEGT